MVAWTISGTVAYSNFVMSGTLPTAGRMTTWPVTRSRCSTSGPAHRPAPRPTAPTPRRSTTCACRSAATRAPHGRRRARGLLAARVRPRPRRPPGAGLRRRRLPHRRRRVPPTGHARGRLARHRRGRRATPSPRSGATPTSPDPTVLVGHSAGGQLVTWAAAQPWAHGLRGVVSLAGVLDLAHGARHRCGRRRHRRPSSAARPSRRPRPTPRADPAASHPPCRCCWSTPATTTSCPSS